MLLGLFAAAIGILGYGGIWLFTTAPMHIVALAFAISCVGMLIWSVGAMAPLQMIEVVSLLSNIMSYSRLMAVGISSMVLADVGNKLAFESPNIFVGLLIGFMFQALNIALSLFSPTLHSLRLNYVESFTKFYEPKGMSYKPFRKELTC
jgi:V/A-type H+-transporting ATPase subunit I